MANHNRNHGIVAVVEDDHSLNHAICRLLRAAGFDARAFESGEALLMDAALHEYRCVIVDVELPGVSGFQLSRALKRNGVRVPIVVVTAHDDAEHRAQAESVGAASYFPKPFSSAAFLASIIEVIEHGQNA